MVIFFFQAEDGIRDIGVTGVQTCALPILGTPQIQNIIPTTFFGTTTWAAPVLGVVGSVFILVVGLLYLEWRRRQAVAAGEGRSGERRGGEECRSRGSP